MIGITVPVYLNFEGFTRMAASIDVPAQLLVIENYVHNRGVARAWNEGLRKATAQALDFLLVSNDDVVFEPGAIDTLVSHMDGYDVLSMTNINDLHEHEQTSGVVRAPDWSCFMVKPGEFQDKFGWFDEQFFPAYNEDMDMEYRIGLANGRQGKLLDACMTHEKSVTGKQVVSNADFERNGQYYLTKWGGPPYAEKWTTPFNNKD